MQFFINKRAKQYSKCCLTNCKRHILNKDTISFFTFPKNLLVTYHKFNFEAGCSNNKLHIKNRLKPDAVPTLFGAMKVECVDDPKNNDDAPECVISDFVPLSCSTLNSSAHLSINSQS